ncbi:MAG: 4-demethylwyosine synthase TYW1 [Candidatus Verstraetearchaeota archaeon]|jgi:tRNA wybutosine-synthesizing protein 1|nr:4-demethylwyosine synthase TYW1 [Candidatus Verstraetearchaeota archaeon]
MNDELLKILKSQGYQIVGKHSAVKTCHWVRKALTEGEICYKGKFYGIKTHRCLQMSPSVVYCTNRCIYCWRILPGERGISWNGSLLIEEDDPEFIAKESIKAHRRALIGYKGNPKVKKEILEEALNPKHVAISLSGEPTLYSRISELIEEYHKMGMTTFLVTNGTRPEVLEKIKEPTQLYISLSAPSEEIYKKVCRPVYDDNWNKLIKSISLLRSFNCRTVIRITLVRNLNMNEIDGYAKLIKIGMPKYIEVKAYMHLGCSTWRLKEDAMPTHEEVLLFSKKLAEKINYEIIDEVQASRVVLLKS